MATNNHFSELSLFAFMTTVAVITIMLSIIGVLISRSEKAKVSQADDNTCTIHTSDAVYTNINHKDIEIEDSELTFTQGDKLINLPAYTMITCENPD